MSLSRRSFLSSAGAAGVIGVSRSFFPAWMPRLAFAPPGQAGQTRDVLVVVFQRGGMDGLNAVIPYAEGSAYYDKRPTLAIPESSIVDLDGFFGLHPSLSPLKDIYSTGSLAVIHAAGSPDPSRSHFDAMEYMERGIPGDKLTSSGWVNRHLQSASWQNDSPFRAVGMGTMMPSSLRGPASTLSLQSIADFHLGGREDQLAGIQRTLAGLYSVQAPSDMLSAQASGVFQTIDQLSQLNPGDYQPSNGAQYPEGDFGLAMQQIAFLIKVGVGLEVACVDIGGWDTHEEQGTLEGHMPALLDELGRGLAAFHTDMDTAMANITVVSMSEFGRRAQENASAGTDHGHGNCMFVMGGGTNGGRVHARWPGLHTEALDQGDLAITTDYRDVLSEILTNRVGTSAIDQVFPGHTLNLPGIVRAR